MPGVGVHAYRRCGTSECVTHHNVARQRVRHCHQVGRGKLHGQVTNRLAELGKLEVETRFCNLSYSFIFLLAEDLYKYTICQSIKIDFI